MDMNGNDRVHGEYIEGVLSGIVFDGEDIRFAIEHNLVHTALWGNAENTLPQIKKAGTLVSFDYADRLDHPLVEQTLPCVDYGFYSYHKGRDGLIEAFLKDKVTRGMKIAVATFGEEGSLAWDGEKFWSQGIFPAEVVNTVGAGDSFIAGFLYGILMGETIGKSLETGAKIAAEVVGVFEPWTGKQ
jgi:fructoselysine 6-kinase